MSEHDQCLFYLPNPVDDDLVIVIVWTDDIIAGGQPGSANLRNFWTKLCKEFEISDLGEVKDYIGIEVSRDMDKKLLRLDHSHYIRDLVTKFEAEYTVPRPTPMLHKLSLPPTQSDEDVVNEPYRSLIGSLMYPAVWTRPDISFAVGALSQHNNKPGNIHWKAAIDVIRYLKGHAGVGLEYVDNGHWNVEVWSDADWASDLDSAKSVFGYALFLGGNLVSWKSKKIQRVSTSTTDSELEGLYHAATEALWTCGLLLELGLIKEKRFTIHCDNKAVVDIVNGEKFSDKTKHLVVKVAYLRELVQSNTCVVVHVKSEENTADVLTKSLAKNLFSKHVGGLGMRDSDMVE